MLTFVVAGRMAGPTDKGLGCSSSQQPTALRLWLNGGCIFREGDGKPILASPFLPSPSLMIYGSENLLLDCAERCTFIDRKRKDRRQHSNGAHTFTHSRSRSLRARLIRLFVGLFDNINHEARRVERSAMWSRQSRTYHCLLLAA